MGVRHSSVWGLVFLRLKVRNSYVWKLRILTFGVSNSYVWGLVFLRSGVTNSYVWELRILTFGASFLTFGA